MELKHKWIGKIESSEQFHKRNKRFEIIDSIAGLIVFMVSFTYALLSGGLMNWSIMELILFIIIGPVIGFILLSLGLILLVQRSYLIGLHIFVDKEDIALLIKKGNLQKDIENILSSSGIDFIERKKHYSLIYYDLPDGLKLSVGGPIEQGKIVDKHIFLIMIQIQKINTENMETARKIQSLLDNLNIKDNYMMNEVNKPSDAI